LEGYYFTNDKVRGKGREVFLPSPASGNLKKEERNLGGREKPV